MKITTDNITIESGEDDAQLLIECATDGNGAPVSVDVVASAGEAVLLGDLTCEQLERVGLMLRGAREQASRLLTAETCCVDHGYFVGEESAYRCPECHPKPEPDGVHPALMEVPDGE